jgi:hypothetical protein
MTSLLHDIVRTGLVSGIVSGAAAAVFSRLRNRRAAPAINAVSHIAWGGEPPAEVGAGGRNLIVGRTLHLGAAMFWAAFFEGLFGRDARRDPAAAWAAGGGVATAAFLTDYIVVPRRLRPGMEDFLSRRGLIGVYAALGAGFALAARMHPDASSACTQDPAPPARRHAELDIGAGSPGERPGARVV